MQYIAANVRSTLAARHAARNLSTFSSPEHVIDAMQRVADDCDCEVIFDIIMVVDDEGEDRYALDTPNYRITPDYDEPMWEDWEGMW